MSDDEAGKFYSNILFEFLNNMYFICFSMVDFSLFVNAGWGGKGLHGVCSFVDEFC